MDTTSETREHMRYRIKLYGHTDIDPETFYRKLADTLDVGIEDCKRFIREAPVTIAEGIDEEDAGSLQSRLESIKALFILEPTGDDSEYRASAKAEAFFPTAETAAPPFPLPKGDSLRWLAWSGVLAVLAGLILLFVVAAFTSTHKKFESAQPSSPGQASEALKSSEGSSEDQIAAENAELAENIIARIDRLEQEIPGLRAELKEVMEAQDLPNQRSTIMGLKDEIRARNREIRTLKLKLQGLTGLYEEK